MLANGGTLLLAVAPDGRVLAFTVSIPCLLVFSRVWRRRPCGARQSQSSAQEARAGGHRRIGKALVIAQLSISMVLVVAPALCWDARELYGVDRGLRTDGVLTSAFESTNLSPGPRPRGRECSARTVSDMPGVTSASAAMVVRIGGGLWTATLPSKVTPSARTKVKTLALMHRAEIFATLATPLLLDAVHERDTGSAGKSPS